MRALTEAAEGLREGGVLRTPDFLGDLGEWFVEALFGGFRGLQGSRKGWDVQIAGTGERLRVRAHLFDRARPWSRMEGLGEGYTHLAVVVLTSEFRLRDLYKVPRSHVPLQQGKDGGHYYRWSDLEPWRVDPRSLPGTTAVEDLVAG